MHIAFKTPSSEFSLSYKTFNSLNFVLFDATSASHTLQSSVSTPAATAQLRITAINLSFLFCIVLKTNKPKQKGSQQELYRLVRTGVLIQRDPTFSHMRTHSSIVDSFFTKSKKLQEVSLSSLSSEGVSILSLLSFST